MGRKRDPVRAHFQNTREPCNQHGDYYHLCLHCVHEKEVLTKKDSEAGAAFTVKKIYGNVVSMRKHIASCPFTPEARMARIAPVSQGYSLEIAQASTAAFPVAPLSPEEIDRKLRLLLELQAENNIADTFIEKESTLRLIKDFVPQLLDHVPSRRTFGGSFLQKYAAEVIAAESDKVMDLHLKSGGRMNLLSDVWQNISKKHLLGAQLGLFGSIATLGLFPTGSRHDGLEIASQTETLMEGAESKGWCIGGVVTDDAGQCRRCRKILALRWPKVVFLKCFAHDMNNLMKSILRIDSFRQVSAQAQALVKFLNASSSKWLPRVHEVMEQTYGGSWQFKTLCPTRWNSMQGCFASLLRVKTAMQMFAVKYRDDPDFNSTLRILEDNEFWTLLKDAEQVVNPICFASFKLQSDENTLADVVVVFRDLYDKFSTSIYRDDLLRLVEVRWADCEQPLFMLALYLHPAYYKDAVHLVDTKVSGRRSICEIAEYYYKRLLGDDPVTIAGELDDWLDGTYMGNSPKELRHFETSSLPPLAAFWRHLKNNNPTHFLPKLALAILAISVNTATCERYFSELALIHTSLRNRMDAEKARNWAAIRKHLREKSSKKVEIKPPAKRMISSREFSKVSAFSTLDRRSSSSRNSSPFTPIQSRAAMNPDAGDDGDDNDLAIDDVVFHWETVLSAMEEGDDSELQALLDMVDVIHRNEAGLAANEEEKDEEEEEEDIRPPERLPFPEQDDKTFPQERISLRSLRGRKVSLGRLRTQDNADTHRQLDFTRL